MAMHWNYVKKNGYVLPQWFISKYGTNPRADQCLAKDLLQLKTKRVWYRGKWRVTRCRTLAQILVVAKDTGMSVMYEMKGAEEFRTDETQKAIQRARTSAGLPKRRFMVAALDTIPGFGGRLRAAHKYHDTVLLRHSTTPIPVSLRPYITWVRSGTITWDYSK